MTLSDIIKFQHIKSLECLKLSFIVNVRSSQLWSQSKTSYLISTFFTHGLGSRWRNRWRLDNYIRTLYYARIRTYVYVRSCKIIWKTGAWFSKYFTCLVDKIYCTSSVALIWCALNKYPKSDGRRALRAKYDVLTTWPPQHPNWRTIMRLGVSAHLVHSQLHCKNTWV